MPHKFTIAFFHPYCNAGGGGERVLWCAIASLASVQDVDNMRIVIYTGDIGVSPAQILRNAQERFGISIPNHLDVEFVYIHTRTLLEAHRYPRFTMLGQSLGSVLVAWECLRACNPDVFIDTTGYAFTFLVAKLLAGCLVGCYVHYPTITADMMRRVHERRPTYNNDERVAGSAAASWAKLTYYRMFAAMYRWVGGLTDVIMTNSSWTQGHINELWNLPGPAPIAEEPAISALRSHGDHVDDDTPEYFKPRTGMWQSIRRALSQQSELRPRSRVVFPPCNTEVLEALPLGNRKRIIVSVGQFRPEKDHELQLRAFADFRERDPAFDDVRLFLIGGCRDDGDRARVAALKQQCHQLKIAEHVDFKVNVSLSELRTFLGEATAGLHTMWNEHFGIGVVEMMAAGIVPVAHNSGGPKSDIVVPFQGERTGFLASTVSEYADALQSIFSGEVDLMRMTSAARQSVTRFSDGEFSDGFFSATIGMINIVRSTARRRRRALDADPSLRVKRD